VRAYYDGSHSYGAIVGESSVKSTVLLIDDDPIDIKALQALLESWGYNILTARSGEQGLTIVKEFPVDLLISDVRMPEMSGETVVKTVREAAPSLPVILITGYGDIRSAVRSMKLGAYDYVIKPPDEDEFRLTIERALEHSRLHRENQFLRAELAAGGMYGERLLGKSEKMLEVFDIINRAAMADSTVLITGETGTGKELVAQTLHFKSNRAEMPLISLNCAALNPGVIESELFGHEKGAFTGAIATRRGRFEDAHGGTIFLDEISETSPEFQAKLLRVLQESEFERVGGGKPIHIDVRVIASTNRNLERQVEDNKFREDLFYRLRVIPIHIPPLRERREDIGLLAQHFLSTFSERYQGTPRTISNEGLSYLESQEWKGNVRELLHAIERAVVLSDHEVLQPENFQVSEATESDAPGGDTLREFVEHKTREHIVNVLERTQWRKQKAADLLGIDRATLYRMLKKHSIEVGGGKSEGNMNE